jgi:hypothetical protein
MRDNKDRIDTFVNILQIHPELLQNQITIYLKGCFIPHALGDRTPILLYIPPLITGFVTRLKRRVLLVEQELLTLTELLSSSGGIYNKMGVLSPSACGIKQPFKYIVNYCNLL